MEGAFCRHHLWSDFDSIADHQGRTDWQNAAHAPEGLTARRTSISKTGCTRAARPGWRKPRAPRRWNAANGCLRSGTPVWRAHGGSSPTCPCSLRSADLRYGLAAGTAGFCNAYDDLLRYARLWLHGHLHAPSDYTAQGAHTDGTPLAMPRGGQP